LKHHITLKENYKNISQILTKMVLNIGQIQQRIWTIEVKINFKKDYMNNMKREYQKDGRITESMEEDKNTI
jgi:hypothetical protein